MARARPATNLVDPVHMSEPIHPKIKKKMGKYKLIYCIKKRGWRRNFFFLRSATPAKFALQAQKLRELKRATVPGWADPAGDTTARCDFLPLGCRFDSYGATASRSR